MIIAGYKSRRGSVEASGLRTGLNIVTSSLVSDAASTETDRPAAVIGSASKSLVRHVIQTSPHNSITIPRVAPFKTPVTKNAEGFFSSSLRDTSE